MTLSKMMFFHFLYVGCDGNRSTLARELGIYRPRVNSMIAELDLGSSLGTTMPRLLEQYRRHGMDINAIVDQYLETNGVSERQRCPVRIQLSDAQIRWRIMEKSPCMAAAVMCEQVKTLAACMEEAFCCGSSCSKDCDAKCPCWWMAGLMESLLGVTAGDNSRIKRR